ncbi:hypothetical protein HKBW3S42_01473, partial [Candidatus Hakubella thermalkaliphila]
DCRKRADLSQLLTAKGKKDVQLIPLPVEAGSLLAPISVD